MVAEGDGLLKKAKRARRRKKTGLLADGLKKYARAYLLLTGRKLQNDAPDLLQKIGEQLAATNGMAEVAALRQQLLKDAINATVDGRLTDAYDHLAALRDLDPRDPTVDYALGVIGQKMEGQ